MRTCSAISIACLLLCYSLAAIADSRDSVAGRNGAPDSLEVQSEVQQHLSRGQYDAAIKKINVALGEASEPDTKISATSDAIQSPTPDTQSPAPATKELDETDKRLLYWRGHALYRICWWGAAERDFMRLGDYSIGQGWTSASEYVRKIQRLRALAPRHVYAVRNAGKVVFRVYYAEDNDWTRAIIALLPQAYTIGKKLFQTDTIETAVLIFSHGPTYNAFYRALTGGPPTAWQWASGGNGLMMFCQRDADGSMPASNTGSDYFRGSVAHEYTHCLMQRAMGTARLPAWMNEGLAMVAASRMAPDDVHDNDAAMKRLFVTGAVLSLREMDKFYQTVEHKYVKNEGQTDAYQQGFHMTRYLLSRMKPEDLPKFLNLVIETGNLEKAFQRAYKISLPDFYNSWLKTTARIVNN